MKKFFEPTNQPSLNELHRLVIDSISDTAWIAAINYNLMWVSPSISQQRGFSPEELICIPLEKQMTSASFVELRTFITEHTKISQENNQRSSTGTLELELHRKDGTTFWSEENITILFNSEAKPVHIIGIGRDISNRKKTENELLFSEILYHSLFEHFPTGMYRTTPEGKILEVNPALVSMLKADNLSDVIGRNAKDFFVDPDDRQKQQKRLETEDKLLQSELQMKCFDGSIIIVRDNARVVRDNAGKVQFYEGSLEDITVQRNAENALRESEERYRTLVSNMSEGLTIVDTNETVLFSNPTADEMFGVRTGSMIGRNLSEFLSEEQYQLVRRQTLNRLKGQRATYEIEINRPDNQTRNLRVTATPQVSDQGKIISSFGVIHDITQRKTNEQVIQQIQAQLRQQLMENEQRRHELDLLTKLGNELQACSSSAEIIKVFASYAQSIFSNCSGSFYVLNESIALMERSLTWGNDTGLAEPISVSSCWSLRFSPPHRYQTSADESNPFCEHALLSRNCPTHTLCTPVLSGEKLFGLLHLWTSEKDGAITDVQVKLSTVIAEQIRLVISNITLRESLRQQAIRDPLTGTFNRYYLEESLQHEIERAKRGNYPMGIIMLDFDKFKELNTTCGHPKVDEMLKEFGKLIRTEFRASDLCCRYGGDEFIIILPQASLEITLSRAEKLRNLVKQLKILKNGEKFPVTISAGVAAFPENGQTIDVLVNSADEALLKAKHKHDCITSAS